MPGSLPRSFDNTVQPGITTWRGGHLLRVTSSLGPIPQKAAAEPMPTWRAAGGALCSCSQVPPGPAQEPAEAWSQGRGVLSDGHWNTINTSQEEGKVVKKCT